MTDSVQEDRTKILFEVVCLDGLCHQHQTLLLNEGEAEAAVTTSRVVEVWHVTEAAATPR
jgi:hypothetical protein